MPRTPATRLLAAGAALTAGALLLTACGSSKIDGSSSPSASDSASSAAASGASTAQASPVSAATPDAALVALLPAALKAKGTVTIATDSTYAPAEFKDASGAVVGFDVDLGNAIFAKLGLRTNWQSADFGSILAGIAAKKYDLSFSSFTDTKAREKQVDMVQYYNAGEAIATLTGNPDKLSGKAADLCGVKVAVQTNTTESAEIQSVINPACKKAGKKTIPNNGDQYDAQSDATTALIAGRDQAMMADSPVIDYAVKQSQGKIEKIGQNYNMSPYGIALPKGDGQLAQAVQGAVKDIIADGTYASILAKWGVSSGALTAGQIVIDSAAS